MAETIRARADSDLFDRPYQIILSVPTHPLVHEIARLLFGRRDIGLHTISGEADALKLVEQVPVSLLLLSTSTKSEVLTALNLLKSLVKLGRVQNLRIMAISKFDDPRLASTFLNAGCNEYIPQRITRSSLLFKINLHLKALRARQLELERELALKLGIDLEPDALASDFGGTLDLTSIDQSDVPSSQAGNQDSGPEMSFGASIDIVAAAPAAPAPDSDPASLSAWRADHRMTPGISRFLKRRRPRRDYGKAQAGTQAPGTSPGKDLSGSPLKSNIQLFIELSDRMRQGKPPEVTDWLIRSLQARLGASSVSLIKLKRPDADTGCIAACVGSRFQTGQNVLLSDFSPKAGNAMVRTLHDADRPTEGMLGLIALEKGQNEPGFTDSQIALIKRLERLLGSLLAKI